MKVDGEVSSALDRAGESAREAESSGCDGGWTSETSHDPFLAVLLAAQTTRRLELGTSVAIAFARNPMTVAVTANDLQTYSKGRFILGLGSQIEPHITRRFSMPWSHPANRMREFVMAMRAIWDCWHNGSKLDFRGDHYTHTLMTPFFDPGPSPYGVPAVFLAGVGELMTEAAGEVCDGFICHGFTTESYLREVTMPALQRGRARAGRTMEDFEVAVPSFVVTGATEDELASATAEVRQHMAFYGSTPAYRRVLELHGWGELQDELNTLSKEGRWAEMAGLIDDEILRTFAVVGEPQEIAPELRRRFGDIADRIRLHTPYECDPEHLALIRQALRAA